MHERGITSKEVLLVLLVVAVAAAILVPVGISMQAKNQADSDVGRMRRVYMGTAMYEQDSQGYMPNHLGLIRQYLPDDASLQSTKDPFVGAAGKFPLDGGMPKWRVESPVRVSYAFLYAFVAAKQVKVKPWYEQKYDVTVGFLANEWQGNVDPGSNFEANVGGKLLRLNTDGSLHPLERPGMRPLGNPQEIFLAKG